MSEFNQHIRVLPSLNKQQTKITRGRGSRDGPFTLYVSVHNSPPYSSNECYFLLGRFRISLTLEVFRLFPTNNPGMFYLCRVDLDVIVEK